MGKGLEKGTEIFEGFNNCEEVGFNVERVYCDPDRIGIALVNIENEKNVEFRDGFVLRAVYNDGEVEEVGSFFESLYFI